MSRTIIVLGAALLGVAFGQADRLSAQATQYPAVQRVPLRADLTLTQPVVVAGPDVGFRILRMDGGIPVGQVVVRMNGAWVSAEIGSK